MSPSVKHRIMNRRIVIVVLIMLSVGLAFAIILHDPTKDVCVVLPNEYEGYVRIVQESQDYDMPYSAALENYRVLEYHVGDDAMLKVESLKHFRTWTNITMGFEWVEPVVHHSEAKQFPGDTHVFGDPVWISEQELWFWTGKHSRMKGAYEKGPKKKGAKHLRRYRRIRAEPSRWTFCRKTIDYRPLDFRIRL